jgi:hypothetical protein
MNDVVSDSILGWPQHTPPGVNFSRILSGRLAHPPVARSVLSVLQSESRITAHPTDFSGSVELIENTGQLYGVTPHPGSRGEDRGYRSVVSAPRGMLQHWPVVQSLHRHGARSEEGSTRTCVRACQRVASCTGRGRILSCMVGCAVATAVRARRGGVFERGAGLRGDRHRIRVVQADSGFLTTSC